MRYVLVCLLVALAGCREASPFGAPVAPATAEALLQVAPQGRLSGVAKPLAYRVDMDVDPRQPRFGGHVEIDVYTETSATGLWLHGDDLDMRSVSVTVGGETRLATWTEVLPSGVVWVGFPNRVKAGNLTLTFDYEGVFDVNLSGLFRVEEKGEAYALAKSESIQARRFLPGFDEPVFKAPFDIALTIPEGMEAISNAPEESREPARPGYETVRFLRTRPQSTYLLSVAVGPFDRVTRVAIAPNAVRSWPVPLTGYARKGKGPELDYILSITPALVAAYEEAFQQPYPYKKLDIVAAPQWPSGATELASAITYRESLILHSEQSGPGMTKALESIHAHELTHMWLGDLVTPPWWDDLWLKEAFATWGAVMALSAIDPDGGHDIEAVSDSVGAMALDSLASARVVAEPITLKSDIRNAYDAITYRKGMAIIRMVDTWFGPDVFRPALGDYVADYADGAADSADFFRSISAHTEDARVGEVFESFVTQSGVPLVEARLQCAAGGAKVALRQQRYAPTGSAIDRDRFWKIPVCLSWTEGALAGTSCALMKERSAVVVLDGAQCPDFYHPNADGAGYYRFTFTGPGWDKMQASIAHLPATEALSALDSAIAAFSAGSLDGRGLRGMLAGAAQHGDQSVTNLVLDTYESLLQRLDGDAAGGLIRDATAASRLLREQISSGQADQALEIRLDAFDALVLKEPAARQKLLEGMQAYLADPSVTTPISSDQYRAALSVYLDEGGLPAFERVVASFSEIDDSAYGLAVASALGSVADEAQSARVRDLIASAQLGPRETYALASGQMAAPETREETWAYLSANFPAFLRVIPTQWQRNTPRLASQFCDEAGLASLNGLFSEYGALAEGYERALAQTREAITLCMAQRQSTQESLEAAFATPKASR